MIKQNYNQILHVIKANIYIIVFFFFFTNNIYIVVNHKFTIFNLASYINCSHVHALCTCIHAHMSSQGRLYMSCIHMSFYDRFLYTCHAFTCYQWTNTCHPMIKYTCHSLFTCLPIVDYVCHASSTHFWVDYMCHSFKCHLRIDLFPFIAHA